RQLRVWPSCMPLMWIAMIAQLTVQSLHAQQGNILIEQEKHVDAPGTVDAGGDTEMYAATGMTTSHCDNAVAMSPFAASDVVTIQHAGKFLQYAKATATIPLVH